MRSEHLTDTIQTTTGDGWNLLKLKDDVEVILGDVRDYDSVYSSIKSCNAVSI